MIPAYIKLHGIIILNLRLKQFIEVNIQSRLMTLTLPRVIQQLLNINGQSTNMMNLILTS